MLRIVTAGGEETDEALLAIRQGGADRVSTWRNA